MATTFPWSAATVAGLRCKHNYSYGYGYDEENIAQFMTISTLIVKATVVVRAIATVKSMATIMVTKTTTGRKTTRKKFKLRLHLRYVSTYGYIYGC